MSGIGIELAGLHPMMLAANHAPQPCEVAFCPIGVDAREAVSLGMIDPFHREGRGEHVPVSKIVGGDDAALDNALSWRRQRLRIPAEMSGSGSDLRTFPQGHDHTPLVRPILKQPPIDPVSLQVGLADMATEVGAIHLDRTC